MPRNSHYQARESSRFDSSVYGKLSASQGRAYADALREHNRRDQKAAKYANKHHSAVPKPGSRPHCGKDEADWRNEEQPLLRVLPPEPEEEIFAEDEFVEEDDLPQDDHSEDDLPEAEDDDEPDTWWGSDQES
ncbi:MAG: hypothetical protein MMC23_009141 [Stictis urceolatum]|nr:hypothetical protein [Stictis urceolata]